MQQTHRQRPHASIPQSGYRRLKGRFIQCHQDVAVGTDTFRRLKPQMTGHQWFRHLNIEIEQVVAPFPPDLKDISKTCGRY